VLPHNGIDYAASYGTPIISVADGVVANFGWMGGYGNRIEIRHNERYGSQYSHMSAYADGLRIGDRVAQGDIVGYVGSTGYSTGNHVHFSMTEYGNYVDPSAIDVPAGEPVPESDLAVFLQLVEEMQQRLEAIESHA
jgi:murein DD-endopeptidase MepM/ murein hydrolase activator NlpD